VFGVFDDGERKRLVTAESGVLEGVSRRTVIEMARAAGLDVQARPWAADELRAADEVFLSSTGGGVIAIASLDGRPVGGRAAGNFGPVTRQLQAAYWALHEDPAYTEPI
jgi:branched-chain amino acid aminotransferase